jgi:hypothetical protein
MTEQKSAGSSPSTTSTTSTKTTTQPPKTDEDKDIESQSRTWGERIRDIPKDQKKMEKK